MNMVVLVLMMAVTVEALVEYGKEYREGDHRRRSQNGDHAAFGGSDFGTALLRGRGGFLFRAGRYVSRGRGSATC